MKKEIAEKWTKALRSGKYKQGTGELRAYITDEVQFCCLGVLCEISQQGQWRLESPGCYLGIGGDLKQESFPRLGRGSN